MAAPQRPRAWQRMLSGRRLNLLDPSPLDVEIEDIAHGLARMARWNGQTVGAHAFSVAQHCLLVEEIVNQMYPDWPVKWRLAALLHDAAEYVIGDLISPFKSAIGLDYKTFENGLLTAIQLRFGLPPAPPASIVRAIKTADHVAAYFEATQLAGFEKAEADKLFLAPQNLPGPLQGKLSENDFTLTPLAPSQCQQRYLSHFNDLLASL